MLRTGKCNHCGQCCGGKLPDGTNVPRWPSSWPEAMDEWSREALEEHPLYSLVGHPRLTGHRAGVTNVDGKEFPYIWLPGVGLVQSKEDHSCPFLMRYRGAEIGRCGVYGTSHHNIWEFLCGSFPPIHAHPSTVIKIFHQFPGCSHEYIQVEP
jgi:hypothetical protein